ncbi:MAG: hypothetical protein R3E02_06500 [Blastomonas sp.]
MSTAALSQLWAKSGLVWLLAAMVFGMYLGLTGQFGVTSSHAHSGLLGGVWAMLFSYLYHRADAAHGPVKGALAQWGTYNIGVAMFVTALWMVIHGWYMPVFGPMIALGGFTVLFSTLWIVLTLWRRIA